MLRLSYSHFDSMNRYKVSPLLNFVGDIVVDPLKIKDYVHVLKKIEGDSFSQFSG